MTSTRGDVEMNTLPNSLEAEENIIASILVDNSNCKYIDKLEEIDFYNQKTKVIFKIICYTVCIK